MNFQLEIGCIWMAQEDGYHTFLGLAYIQDLTKMCTQSTDQWASCCRPEICTSMREMCDEVSQLLSRFSSTGRGNKQPFSRYTRQTRDTSIQNIGGLWAGVRSDLCGIVRLIEFFKNCFQNVSSCYVSLHFVLNGRKSLNGFSCLTN
jgi:hypothetical protein